ncbi:hypothetical protein ACFXAF_00835 [Kitasatospora sp. NPDC059463]|uniref:hypothetical protein n=1 Tax=unclassified Kitasatospora TaxID=2633591 RepID=UPI00368A3141
MAQTKQRGLIGLEVEIAHDGLGAQQVVYLAPGDLAEAEVTMARLRDFSTAVRREAAAGTGHDAARETGT